MRIFNQVIVYSNDPLKRVEEKTWVETVLQLDARDPKLFESLNELGYFRRMPPGWKGDEPAFRDDWPGFKFELKENRVELFSDDMFVVELLGNFVSAFLRRFRDEKEIWICTYATVAPPHFNGGGALVVNGKTWRTKSTYDAIHELKKELGAEGPPWLMS